MWRDTKVKEGKIWRKIINESILWNLRIDVPTFRPLHFSTSVLSSWVPPGSLSFRRRSSYAICCLPCRWVLWFHVTIGSCVYSTAKGSILWWFRRGEDVIRMISMRDVRTKSSVVNFEDCMEISIHIRHPCNVSMDVSQWWSLAIEMPKDQQEIAIWVGPRMFCLRLSRLSNGYWWRWTMVDQPRPRFINHRINHKPFINMLVTGDD